MALIRPRLTDHYGITRSQMELDFAIPFLDEDLPLYVDPFLLWKSPSLQDKSLHGSILTGFNHLGYLVKQDRRDEAVEQLIIASECDEVGLGVSKSRHGVRIGRHTADSVLDLFDQIPDYNRRGFTHFEEIQFFVNGISRDRISDLACSFLKSFLIDFTIDQCELIGVPTVSCTVRDLYDLSTYRFVHDTPVALPVRDDTGEPILLVPKRWLRFHPWLGFDEYFKTACPQDDIVHEGAPLTRVKVLNFNRDNYGVVKNYVAEKERTAADCHNDPLFEQIPVLSAKRSLGTITRLPPGTVDRADRQFEDEVSKLLASLLYPHLDFAATQSRTASGVLIRDVIFYNNSDDPFLAQLLEEYGSRQLVFELKNVATLERDHVNQLNRYLADELGRFGVLVTRHNPPKSIWKNLIDLWSGQRRCIICLTDADLAQMVELYESKQRRPLDVVKKKYVEFRRACPS